MKFKIAALILISVSVGLFSAEFSVEKAKRVDDFLRRIREKDRKTVFLKKMTFTQRELNSYINIFYLKRYSPEVKYLKLNFRKNNYVTGVMKVKLTGKKYESVPSFLRDIELEFSGKLECKNYRVRYIFNKMEINGTLFAPEILDEAFHAAQSNIDLKKSIFDWFSLLPGLKNVIIDYKKITIYY
ncbi:MAG: hypothetical protein KAT17_00500 [Candidatus Aminicenantes bacterium]|nr:hypothetical protein [Candidatus Aminicenantes bacterium]